MPEQQAFSFRNSFPHNHERSEVIDEMAKDEARHGRALKGMLDRYFAKEIALEKAAAKANKVAEKAVDAAADVASKLGDIFKK